MLTITRTPIAERPLVEVECRLMQVQLRPAA